MHCRKRKRKGEREGVKNLKINNNNRRGREYRNVNVGEKVEKR